MQSQIGISINKETIDYAIEPTTSITGYFFLGKFGCFAIDG
jgi:hypothetical protein